MGPGHGAGAQQEGAVPPLFGEGRWPQCELMGVPTVSLVASEVSGQESHTYSLEDCRG